MTPAEYRSALAEVGLSLSGASKFFQTDERTTRRWADDDSGKTVPHAVAITLRLMAKYQLTSEDVVDLMNEADDAAGPA
ncbi:hypothetical protein ACFQI3_04875 [Hansschlegelia quercus]|uniref:XRE family transcriptional regulator n=1 Tax=Hansschlegelia quercus TaxID=2528245 RepID=A0A4Q9GPP7_9HYPH|nr:hypothetical protein [Hansschlegelia quercus]TBN55205.1 hypothetical protein EYR15_03470 [Hansschlegelia quercus]